MYAVDDIYMIKNLFFKLLLSLNFILLLLTQAAPSQASASDSLTVWLDYACFKLITPDLKNVPVSNPKLAYVEIYYALDRSQLDLSEADDIQIATLNLSMKIKDPQQNQIDSLSWPVGCSISPNDTSQSNFILYDLQALQLLSGEYSLNFAVTQANSNKVGNKKITLKVPDFSDQQLKLSDIQLALGADPDTSESKFVKAGRMILPNATKIYGATSPVLYFYSEAYNLAPGSADNTYNISYTILDSLGNIHKEYPASSNKKPGSSAVILSGLNISTLPRGKYQLQINLEDPQIQSQVTAKKEFWVRKETLVTRLTSEKVPVPQNEQEAKLIRAELSYIATQDELRMYDQLNLTGKQSFLKEFWNKKDPDPSTPVNEFKVQFYQKIFEANQMFASQSDDRKTGWRTDQGKIYVKYGKPDFIERHHYTRQTKPWEKWIYNNLQGGVYFIFSDEEGYGIYRLVHSTARGEKNDPNWERALQEIIEE